jgi:hypothetical protein
MTGTNQRLDPTLTESFLNHIPPSVTQRAHIARIGYCRAGPNVVDLEDVVVDHAIDQIETRPGDPGTSCASNSAVRGCRADIGEQ